MVEIRFNNAEVSDTGYGLRVNGKSIEDIISVALGVKAKAGYANGENPVIKPFSSNACDVVISISPHKQACRIDVGDDVFVSVEEMEEVRHEQYTAEHTAEADES